MNERLRAYITTAICRIADARYPEFGSSALKFTNVLWLALVTRPSELVISKSVICGTTEVDSRA